MRLRISKFILLPRLLTQKIAEISIGLLRFVGGEGGGHSVFVVVIVALTE